MNFEKAPATTTDVNAPSQGTPPVAASAAQKGKWGRRLLVFLLAFAPTVFLGWLTWEKSVDIGCWDVWENAPLLQKWHDGVLTWHDLYAPQIQHRIVIPRLMIITMAHLSGGDFRWENYVCFFLFLVSGLLIWRLMAKTLGQSLWVAALAFASNLLIFSPMLYQVLFWGSAMWMAIPMPCMLAILNLGTSNRPIPLEVPPLRRPWLYFVGVVLLAEIATHSFSYGLAFWPVVLVYLLIHPGIGPIKRRLAMAGAWVVIAAGTITSYFTNFYNVAFHAYNLKPGDYAMEGGIALNSAENIEKFLAFFFGFLGNPFARTPFEDHPLASATVIGRFVLISFLVVAALTVFTKRGRKMWPQALPWLALAAYVLGVAVSISKGRAHIGEHRSVTTRYLVISSFLPIATMALAYLHSRTWVDWLRATPGSRAARWLPVNAPAVLAAVLISAFCTFQLPLWRYSLHLTDIWSQARWQAKGLTMFLPHFPLNRDEMNVLCKDYRYCLDAVNSLKSMGLFKTRVLESPDLKTFKTDPKPLGKEKAEVLTAKFLEDGSLELSGHARFAVKQPTDLVLITHGEKVVGLMQPQTRQWLRIYGLDYEFANLEDTPVQKLYPWLGVVKPAVLASLTSDDQSQTQSQSQSQGQGQAPGEVVLGAWALDVKDNRVTRIPNVITVNVAAKTATVGPFTLQRRQTTPEPGRRRSEER